MNFFSRTIFLAIALGLSQNVFAARTCNDNLLTLSCFPSYESQLTDAHNAQLTRIGRLLELRDKMNTQVKRIQLRGYGVRYSSSDPYKENAVKRAESVELKLRQVLKDNGIDVANIAFEIIGMADKNPIAAK